jgi:hypothetical protein
MQNLASGFYLRDTLAISQFLETTPLATEVNHAADEYTFQINLLVYYLHPVALAP